MWAKNAWDISAPQVLIFMGLAVFLVAFLVYLGLARLGLRPLLVALALAGTLLILLHWNTIDTFTPLTWLVAVASFAIAGHILIGDRLLKGIAYVIIAVLGVAPIVQLVIAHVVQRDPYPIVELAPRAPAAASPEVEDVLLVVVDTYPGPVVTSRWLEHDPEPLTTRLVDLGYTVLPNAFSQHTYTGLAIPSMLELQPITTPELSRPWGNRRTKYAIIRGDNLVALTLGSAGYTYTHLENGWDGGVCGRVDVCIHGPLLKELTWEFLMPTVIGQWMVERHGAYSLNSTISVAETLMSLEPIFDDGSHDYVYAHMLLPHPPAVADSDCRPLVRDVATVESYDPENPETGERGVFDAQFTCVDTLLSQIAGVVGEDTAVLITGDHGTSTNGQVGTPGETWTDADIAERMSIFLAYRMPDGCSPPMIDTNIEAMKAIMTCATDMTPPANNGMFLIEARDPNWVEPARMASIQDRLADGEILPEPAT
jgi:hypothetical protein